MPQGPKPTTIGRTGGAPAACTGGCHVGRDADVRMTGKFREQRCLRGRIGQCHVDDVDRDQVGFARVEAALEDFDACDVFALQLQHALCSSAQGGQRIFRLRQRELDFGESDHVVLGPC
jgi:hypothetical protein